MDPRILLLVTQVIIESLPISSSGHLRLVELLMARAGVALGSLPAFFDHFLNGPTLVVLGVYFYKPWSTLVRMAWRVVNGLWHGKKSVRPEHGRRVRTASHCRAGLLLLKIVGMVLVAELGMLAWMFVFGRGLKMYENLPLLAGGFALTGLVLASEPGRRGHERDRQVGLTMPKAILLGLLQGLVYGIPGLSRFACTVIVARWLGLSPRRAFEFSFMIFAPLIVAAFTLNGLPAVLADPQAASFFTLPWLLAYAGSLLCAYGLFVAVARLALTGRLHYFAWYMLVPVAVALWLWVW